MTPSKAFPCIFMALTLMMAPPSLDAQVGDPPAGATIYSRDFTSLLIRRDDLNVTLSFVDNGYALKTAIGDKTATLHIPEQGGPAVDAIYLLDGYLCGQGLIETLIRFPPPRYADLPGFRYLRVLMDAETLDVVAHFYDDSVRLTGGLVPIQGLADPGGMWPSKPYDCGADRMGLPHNTLT